MNTFERIHIQGFRRLFDVDIKLNPLNVLIGANGSGKTSILDVFSLLANSASGKLNEFLSEQRNRCELEQSKGSGCRQSSVHVV